VFKSGFTVIYYCSFTLLWYRILLIIISSLDARLVRLLIAYQLKPFIFQLLFLALELHRALTVIRAYRKEPSKRILSKHAHPIFAKSVGEVVLLMTLFTEFQGCAIFTYQINKVERGKTEYDDYEGHVQEESKGYEEELGIGYFRVHVIFADTFCVSQEQE